MAFGGGLANDDDVVSDINMVPLIDVMLVLLIIFIITVPVLTNSVNVDLPRAESQPNPLKPETVKLSVAADGALFWNDEALTESQLIERLGEAASRQPQPAVHIRGDRQAAYEHVVRAMAATQRAGIEKVGFITVPESR